MFTARDAIFVLITAFLLVSQQRGAAQEEGKKNIFQFQNSASSRLNLGTATDTKPVLGLTPGIVVLLTSGWTLRGGCFVQWMPQAPLQNIDVGIGYRKRFTRHWFGSWGYNRFWLPKMVQSREIFTPNDMSLALFFRHPQLQARLEGDYYFGRSWASLLTGTVAYPWGFRCKWLIDSLLIHPQLALVGGTENKFTFGKIPPDGSPRPITDYRPGIFRTLSYSIALPFRLIKGPYQLTLGIRGILPGKPSGRDRPKPYTNYIVGFRYRTAFKHPEKKHIDLSGLRNLMSDP